MPTAHKKQAGIVAAASLVLWICSSAGAAPRFQAAAPQAVAGEFLLSLDPAHSGVHFTVDSTLHAVHGEFAFKRGMIEFSPDTGQLTGEIVVDATSGESGNGSRDKRMQTEILQSDRFMEIAFRPDRIEGEVALSGTSMVLVHGTFLLHGSDHEIAVPVDVDIAGDAWKGTATFEVPYIQWGLKNPSNFFPKVSPMVNIRLEMSGTVQAPH